MTSGNRLLGALLLPLLASGIAGDLPAEDLASLRFSNTASLDAEARTQLGKKPAILADWTEFIDIPPPPANTSEKTAAELAELHKMEQQRTSAAVELIRTERTLDGFDFGKTPYRELAERSPEMKRLLDLVSGEINPIIFALKKRHDRVRPSALDPTLNPCIEIPGHPSYPSGHAAQAFGFAYMFSAVDPDNSDNYFRRASEIAIRREEAGVHFDSDTKAGQELARQVYLALLDKPAYQERLMAARLEFHDGKLPDEFQPPRDPYEILAERKKAKEQARLGAENPSQEKKKRPGFFKNLFNRFGGDDDD